MDHLVTRQYWLEKTDSTMGEARNFRHGNDLVLVSTDDQTSGRGTEGRIWLCRRGNIFMTIAVRRAISDLDTLSLMPLITGITLHQTYWQYLQPEHQSRLWIKWPNDILVDTRKVSGVLMESDDTYLYIGIGINTVVAPTVTDGGRHSGCLRDFSDGLPANKTIVLEIFNSIANFIVHPKPPEDIISNAAQRIDWSRPVFLRSDPKTPMQPIRLMENGGLLLRDGENREKTILSEYLE